jgi:hypothetical protein
MTKGNASTNIQRMGAIQLIIFERLVTTKRVVYAVRTRRVLLNELGPHPTPRDSFGVVFICREPTSVRGDRLLARSLR